MYKTFADLATAALNKGYRIYLKDNRLYYVKDFVNGRFAENVTKSGIIRLINK
jgi:hypothetical protein